MKKLISFNGKRTAPTPPYWKTAMQVIIVLLAAVLLLLNLFTHVLLVVQYYGSGMEPTLSDRQTLIFLRTDQVEPGDIVAFYYNNKVLVRRIIAGGGSTVSIDDAGVVQVDGMTLHEPYLEASSIGLCDRDFPYTVSHGQYFVMGDNRALAMDSRLSVVGTVPADRIIGKVIITF